MNSFSATKSQTQISAAKIFALIENELALVEKEFERQANSNVQVISYLGEYLRASGGKRVRPALTVLANYAVGGNGASENSVRLATVMEMLHSATLVHDDIIDNAKTRRDRESMNEHFGTQNAVLMGDWLYMSAFETSLQERSLEILDILTMVTRKMTEGELIQLTKLGKAEITESEYFDILERKTAFLFSACCEIGGILGGAQREEKVALKNFGMNLGIAFQLADDLLDFTSDSESLGKPTGADLLEGKVTLPLILLLERDGNTRETVEKVLVEHCYGDSTREKILNELQDSGALMDARKRASAFATAARKNLEVLSDSEYRSALDEIASYVVERSR